MELRDGEVDIDADAEAHESPPPRFSILWEGAPSDDESLDVGAEALTLRIDDLEATSCVLTVYIGIDSGVMDSRETQTIPEQPLGPAESKTFQVAIVGDAASLEQAGALSAFADCCGYEEGAPCERHSASTLYVTGVGTDGASLAIAGEKALSDDWNSGALDVEVPPGAPAMTRIVDASDDGADAGGDADLLSVQVEVMP